MLQLEQEPVLSVTGPRKLTQTPEESQVDLSCTTTTTTTTLVKFYPSGPGLNYKDLHRRSRFMKKTKNPASPAPAPVPTPTPTLISPSSSNCAITSSSATVASRDRDRDRERDKENSRDGRPPFITTVTRGKFLPSKFDLFVERSLFTFSSRPRPVGLVTRHQCSLSGGPLKEHNHIHYGSKSSTSPRGAHDYYNMMYDPHIYRGRASTVASTPPKQKIGENETENKPMSTSDSGLNGDTKYRKKRQIYGGNGVGRSRYKITTRVTARTKGLTKGSERQHTHVQTEQFLEDFEADLTADERDAVVQTDAIHDIVHVRNHRSNHIVTKSGVDASTQVLPGELVSFDEEIQPVLEAFVGKILQQSLLETMEEEEIAALREQQNRFLQKRKQEEKLLRELQAEQEKITREKERLRAEMKGEISPEEVCAQNQNPTTIVTAQDRALLDQALRNASINQPNISTSYLIELLPSVLNSLRQEGYLSDTLGDDLFSTFVPMWQSSSKAESEVDIGEPLMVEVESTGSGSSADPDAEPQEQTKLNANATTESRPEEESLENLQRSPASQQDQGECQEVFVEPQPEPEPDEDIEKETLDAEGEREDKDAGDQDQEDQITEMSPELGPGPGPESESELPPKETAIEAEDSQNSYSQSQNVQDLENAQNHNEDVDLIETYPIDSIINTNSIPNASETTTTEASEADTNHKLPNGNLKNFETVD